MSYKTLTNANKKLQMQRIEQAVWTKGDILAFCKMLNSCKFSDQERKNAIRELSDKLDERLEEMPHGYAITEEQSQVGIKWLRANVLTPKGKLRNNKILRNFHDDLEGEIIRKFDRFEFVGFHCEYNGANYDFYTPIYRCIATDGRYFDYYAVHWGICESVSTGKYHPQANSRLYKALTEATA